MHIVIGALLVAGTFFWAMQHMSSDFQGFWNAYSFILLLGVPIGLAVFTYRFRTLGSGFKG